mgnify:FL=1|tara:strand:- start:2029 stop:2457 length:429 start_codon:yes stop_codon:yes gene_type:complete
MKYLSTILITLFISGGLWAQNPEEAVHKFFELFNSTDKAKLNEASDSPFIFLIGNNKTVSENYGDSLDFEGLREQGWAYSKINESELIYSDLISAMVDINFSRISQDKDVLSTTNATYLLLNKEGKWLLKGAFINSNLSLGE